MDLEPDGVHAGALERHILDPCRAALHLGLLDVGPQLDRAVGDLQIPQQPPDVSGGQSERDLGLLVDHRDGVVSGDHDLRDRAGAKRELPHMGQGGEFALPFEHHRGGLEMVISGV